MKRLVLVLLFLCTACNQASEPASAPASSAITPAAPVGAPKAQADILALIRAVKAAPKDQAAYERFCDVFLHTETFDGWSGRISDFRTSTVNQSIDITFDMGQPMHVEQVVQKTDPLYGKIATLKVGQTVNISGRFSHAAGSSECVYYLGSYAVTLSTIA